MNKATSSEVRRSIYESLGEVAAAFASPARLKVIQILAQSGRGVEELARETGESVANVSQHLQKLSRAGLVACERRGVSRIYRVASPLVLKLWEDFQDLGHELVPALDLRERELVGEQTRASESPEQILRAARLKKAVLIDVREEAESTATPVSHALALPLSKIKKARTLREIGLSSGKPVYAVCRGRYCSLAADAVKHLRKLGAEAYGVRESSFRLNLIDGGEA